MEVDIEVRTTEDIQAVMKYAKMEPAETVAVCQPVYFADSLLSDKIRLLQLDESMMNNITEGERLTLRGQATEAAVACTSNKTFDIKEAEISNSWMLLEKLTLPKDTENKEGEPMSVIAPRHVCAVMHSYLELRPIAPRLSRLHTMLHEAPYSGKEYEKAVTGKVYTYNEILDEVQASEEEIKDALNKSGAFEIDGCCRVLEVSYASMVLSSVVAFCEENSWSYKKLDYGATVETLSELHPKEVLRHCLDKFGKKLENTEQDDSSTECGAGAKWWSLEEEPVCRLFGEELLAQAGKFNLSEFLDSWQQTVPEGFTTHLSHIGDLSVVDRDARPAVIWHFPLSSLPEDVGDRFNFLFKAKPRWTKDEIQPFIADRAVGKVDVNALLTKFARSTTINGVKLYNSRRPVT